MLTLVLAGAVVGAVLGLTGAGGGILATPALMASLGWNVQQAAPLALIAVTAGAALGAVEGLRRKQVRYRAALLMAIAGMPFSTAGSLLAQQVPTRWLAVLFALVMLWVAWRNIAPAPALAASEPEPLCALDPETGRIRWTPRTATALASVGAVTGLLTGLLGVGGGFVIVPALRRLTRLNIHSIVATSLLIIALVSGISVAGAWLRGMHVPPVPATVFLTATLLGMLAGRRLVRSLTSRHIQAGFATLVACVACGMLVKALAG